VTVDIATMQLAELLRTKVRVLPSEELLCVSGAFSHSVIESHGRLVRELLRKASADAERSDDLFSVFIEMSQNIQSYAQSAFGGVLAAERDPNAHGALLLLKRGDRLLLCGANQVRSTDVAALKSRLASLDGLDKAELKKRYKQQLKAPVSVDGSAGLGLLAMARIATAPLQHEFFPALAGKTTFVLCVTI
jgi:hypothetical protein